MAFEHRMDGNGPSRRPAGRRRRGPTGRIRVRRPPPARRAPRVRLVSRVVSGDAYMVEVWVIGMTRRGWVAASIRSP